MNDLPPDKTPSGQQSLDALLARYARKPVPTVPGDLESQVWEGIRARRELAQQRRGSDWLSPLLGFWQQPHIALAGVAAAAIIGVGMSWTGAATQAVTVHQALDLGVFSAESPFLPSTLLARAKPLR